MATTATAGDFDRAKGWARKFMADWKAGANGGTGRDRGRSDVTAGPQGGADKMTARTTRFNPPPGWPPAPAGWAAPPGWQPDPSWPVPAPGWQLRVEDRPAISPKAPDALLAMVGGTAVILGSVMPWVSFNSVGMDVKPKPLSSRQSGRFTTARPNGNSRAPQEEGAAAAA